MDTFRKGSCSPRTTVYGNGRCIPCLYHRLAFAGYEWHWSYPPDPQPWRWYADHNSDSLWLVRYRSGSQSSRSDCILCKTNVHVRYQRYLDDCDRPETGRGRDCNPPDSRFGFQRQIHTACGRQWTEQWNCSGDPQWIWLPGWHCRKWSRGSGKS